MAKMSSEAKTIEEHTLVLSDQEARELWDILGENTDSRAYSVFEALNEAFGGSDW